LPAGKREEEEEPERERERERERESVGRLALQNPRCSRWPFRSRRPELHSPAGKREKEEPERERELVENEKKKKEKSEVEMPGQGVKSWVWDFGCKYSIFLNHNHKCIYYI